MLYLDTFLLPNIVFIVFGFLLLLRIIACFKIHVETLKSFSN